jgi:hypothetical protein
MKDFETDIDFITNQVKYLDILKYKLFNDGIVTLTTNDADTLDELTQTLTSFKLLLTAIRSQK